MGGKGPRRPLTAGTMAMLALTALVLLGCVGFFALISGDDLHTRAMDVLRSLREGATAAPTPAPTPAQTEEIAFSTVTPQPVVVTPTPVPQPVNFTLAAGGTVYAPKAVREGAQEQADSYDFTAVFEGLGTALSGADLAMVTLETTTAGREAGYGNYNTPPQILDALRDVGVDLVSLATERALEKGVEGLERTAGELASRSMAYAGISMGGADVPATVMRVGGVQVAVLAYTYGLSDTGAQQDDASRRVAILDRARVAQDIAKARIDGANVVIVLPHWGTKNRVDVQESLRQDARALAEAGADIILGTHPNVAQETERLTVMRADGLTYECVVCYSLGTLLGDSRTPENTAGMIARLTVTYDPVTRRTTLGDLACLPVYVAQQREDGQTVYRVVDVENAAAMERLTASEREAASQAAQIIRDVTGQDEQGGEG